MGRSQFDWRWLILVVVVLLFFGQVNLSLSPLFGIFLLGLCAWWMFQAGLQPWQGRRGMGGPRETYWRGQRVQLNPSRSQRLSLPATLPLISSIGYFILSSMLLLALILRIVGMVQR